MIELEPKFAFPSNEKLADVNQLVTGWGEENGFGRGLMDLVVTADSKIGSEKPEDWEWMGAVYRAWLHGGQYESLDGVLAQNTALLPCPNPDKSEEVKLMTVGEWAAVAIMGLMRVIGVDANTRYNRQGRPLEGGLFEWYSATWETVEKVVEYFGVNEGKTAGVTIDGNLIDWRFETGQDKIKQLELLDKKEDALQLALELCNELRDRQVRGELDLAGRSSLAVIEHRVGALSGDYRYLMTSLWRIWGVAIRDGNWKRLKDLHKMSLKVAVSDLKSWWRK